MIADLEFFEELLSYKEAVDDAIDQTMYQVALERKDEQADISLATVGDTVNAMPGSFNIEIRFGKQAVEDLTGYKKEQQETIPALILARDGPLVTRFHENQTQTLGTPGDL